MRSARLRFGVMCIVGYVLLSWLVRFDMRRGSQIASLVYPLDTFSMYSSVPAGAMSHLLWRTASGQTTAVDAFGAFDCGGPLVGRPLPCHDDPNFAYHYDDLLRFIDQHASSGLTDEMELISRTWSVEPGGKPVVVADCVVARCRVGQAR